MASSCAIALAADRETKHEGGTFLINLRVTRSLKCTRSLHGVVVVDCTAAEDEEHVHPIARNKSMKMKNGEQVKQEVEDGFFVKPTVVIADG